MTQNSTETYSSEEVREAESEEQSSLSAAQNKYLTNRVVTLRAQINRLKKEVEFLRAELELCKPEVPAVDVP